MKVFYFFVVLILLSSLFFSCDTANTIFETLDRKIIVGQRPGGGCSQ